MNFLSAQQNLCRKLNIDFTNVSNGLNGLFSLDDIRSAINDATLQVWDLHPWAVKDGDKKTTATDDTYYDYPTTYRPGSINFLTVDGKEYNKMTWEAYRKYKEDEPEGDDLVWAEHRRFVFINTNAYTIGDEIVMFGRLRTPSLSDDDDLMIFSPDTETNTSSGNESICDLAKGNILSSEKKKMYEQGKSEMAKAYAKLEILWEEESALKAVEKPDGRPLLDVPDFFANNGRGNVSQGNF